MEASVVCFTFSITDVGFVLYALDDFAGLWGVYLLLLGGVCISSVCSR